MPLFSDYISRNILAMGFGYCLHEISTHLRKFKYIKTARSIEGFIYSSIFLTGLSLIKQDYDMGKLSTKNISSEINLPIKNTLIAVGITASISISLTYLLCLKNQRASEK